MKTCGLFYSQSSLTIILQTNPNNFAMKLFISVPGRPVIILIRTIVINFDISHFIIKSAISLNGAF